MSRATSGGTVSSPDLVVLNLEIETLDNQIASNRRSASSDGEPTNASFSISPSKASFAFQM
jgi:hypothetical protein